jgi:hypothetical protein
MSKPIVLTVSDWSPSAIKYMAPKVNANGGKNINTISKQTNRSLHITTPLMMTWGINDFVDDKGEADGKFSLSLNFPNEEYRSKNTDDFMAKLKEFENKILDDATQNSELWFGEEMSREVVKHMFFPILKYSKNKETRKIDLMRPPSIRAKVPMYNNKWAVEIYDTKSQLIFPCEDDQITPADLVPKQSQVACVLQASGIWIGGKGFGVTWKLVQCVVKPREIISVRGTCHVQLSGEELENMNKQLIVEDMEDEDVVPTTTSVPSIKVIAPVPVSKVVDTEVDDSDEEENTQVPVPEPVVPIKVAEPEPVADAPKKKKMVKKATA